MSITRQLERSVNKMRALLQRNNGDIHEAGPGVLDEMDAAIEQVHGLENVTCINTELAQEFAAKGEA